MLQGIEIKRARAAESLRSKGVCPRLRLLNFYLVPGSQSPAPTNLRSLQAAMEAKSGAPVAGYWAGLWDLAVSPAPADTGRRWLLPSCQQWPMKLLGSAHHPAPTSSADSLAHPTHVIKIDKVFHAVTHFLAAPLEKWHGACNSSWRAQPNAQYVSNLLNLGDLP